MRSSETRTYDLLRHYGAKERGGWLSFLGYLQSTGNTKGYEAVKADMQSLFPGHWVLETVMDLMDEGRFEEAEPLAQELVADNPGNGRYLATLGAIKARKGEHAVAIGLFKKAIVTHPNHTNYTGLGRSYMFMREYALALEALEEARRISPAYEPTLRSLCQTYCFLGRIDTAMARADKLFGVNPHAAEAHIVYLVHSLQIGRRDLAAQHYEEFLQYGTGLPEYEKIKEHYAYLSTRN